MFHGAKIGVIGRLLAWQITEDRWLWAVSIVLSRAFETEVNGNKQLVGPTQRTQPHCPAQTPWKHSRLVTVQRCMAPWLSQRLYYGAFG